MTETTRHEPTTPAPRCVAIGRLTEDVIDSLLVPKGTRVYVVSPLTVGQFKDKVLLRCVSDCAVDGHEIIRGWIVYVERSKVEFTGETAMTDSLPDFIGDAVDVVNAKCDD